MKANETLLPDAATAVRGHRTFLQRSGTLQLLLPTPENAPATLPDVATATNGHPPRTIICWNKANGNIAVFTSTGERRRRDSKGREHRMESLCRGSDSITKNGTLYKNYGNLSTARAAVFLARAAGVLLVRTKCSMCRSKPIDE